MKLKELKEGEEFPADFWNYDVNPILGTKYDPIRFNPIKNTKKYGITPLPFKE
jgi:hypothetical protein